MTEGGLFEGVMSEGILSGGHPEGLCSDGLCPYTIIDLRYSGTPLNKLT